MRRWAVVAGALALAACSSDSREGESASPVEAAAPLSAEAAALVARARALGAALPGEPSIGLVSRGGALVPRYPDGAAPRASVALPATANGAFGLEEPSSRLAAFVRLEGASASPGEIAPGGLAIYRDGGPGGSTVIHAVGLEGTEDFVLFDAPPARPEVAYSIQLGCAVAGLRLIGRALELLDETGTPRLRVAPPYLVDAHGARREAALAVTGCAYDSDASAPWGRAPVPAGASVCTLRVSWSADVAYPIVVDPSWTATTSMVRDRNSQTATLLADGRVLVAGGTGSVALADAELYDSASGTWAATGSMAAAHSGHVAVLLASGKVLIAGGSSGSAALPNTEVYNPADGSFATVGSLVTARENHAAVRLPNGDVLVTGGDDGTAIVGTAEIWHPATQTWSAALPMAAPRRAHTADLVAGRVLVSGGENGTLASAAPIAEAELYDPGAGTWTSTGALGAPRSFHTSVVLGTGEVLVMGGLSTSLELLASAELYSPDTGAWTPAGSMNKSRVRFTTTLLQGDRVVVAGGLHGVLRLLDVDIYDRATNGWTKTTRMIVGRSSQAAVKLGDGSALIAGGTTNGGASVASAERFELGGAGDACVGGVECKVGLSCADGVCCTTPCSGPCEACSVVLGAAVDGQCKAVEVGEPGSPSCAPFVCDGAQGVCPVSCSSDSQCALPLVCNTQTHTCGAPKAQGGICQTASECVTGHCVDGFCCQSSCDGPCLSCAAATQEVPSANGVCGLAKAGGDPHNDCSDQGVASCGRDGACDGAGACRIYTEGTVCGLPSCTTNQPADHLCNGGGSCLESLGASCGLYACAGGVCPDTCLDGGDCVDGAYCNDGACTEVKPPGIGQACLSAGECEGGLCVDGFCCSAPCDGQCESCGEPSNEGTCVAVSGEPRLGRDACEGPSAGDPCTARRCDGAERKTCGGFAGEGVVCREASCATDSGEATLEGHCDGSGACPAAETASCEPFACGEAACKTECAEDGDCAALYRCEAGLCTAATSCEDHVVTSADGATVDCAPYQCADDGHCKTTCQSSADCVAPTTCNAAHLCGSGATTAEPDTAAEGCTCEVPGPTAGGRAWLALLGALALGIRRRSRSGRSVKEAAR